MPREYYSVEVRERETFHVDVRYQNLHIVGDGSYGCVARARDTFQDRYVAIKKVPNVFADLVDAKRVSAAAWRWCDEEIQCIHVLTRNSFRTCI